MRGSWFYLCLLFVVGGCEARPSCLVAGQSCEETRPCAELSFACQPEPLVVGTIGEREIPLRGHAATSQDLVLQNGSVVAVFDALDQPRNSGTTGGNLVDFGPLGGEDAIGAMYQAAGALPEDTFSFTEVEYIDESPLYVGLVFRGTLDGHPEVRVATRYELHACEPGLRVHSELRNDSADNQTFVLGDTAVWGGRRSRPFAPLVGQGFDLPELDIETIEEQYTEHAYAVTRPSDGTETQYGFVRCDAEAFLGLNDPQISALGTDIELIRPGEEIRYQRFVFAKSGPGLNASVSTATQVREQLFDEPAAIPVFGSLRAHGLPFSGPIGRAGILLSQGQGAERRPVTVLVPDEEGRISGTVPAAESYSWELWSFGRVVSGGTASARGAQIELGELELELPGRLNVFVVDGNGNGRIARVVLHPADEETRAETTGTFFGTMRECAPWLATPAAGSPACNTLVIPETGTDVEVPAGRYHVYASLGPNYSLARKSVEIQAGEVTSLSLELRDLGVTPPGWTQADLHVHGRNSQDSAVPDIDRARSFASAGIDVIAATDHDWVSDYAEGIRKAGLEGQLVVMGGVETTPLLPFFTTPGSIRPKVIGHFNFWPLVPDPALPRNGAPEDERIEPGALFDRVRPLIGDDGITMLNHPWDGRNFGRDFGYLRAIGYDPRLPMDGSANNRMLSERPRGGARNSDFSVMEIGNGPSFRVFAWSRVFWHSFLSQGFLRAVVGNSDTHHLGRPVGYARTWVPGEFDAASFDIAEFNRKLREGRAVAGTGIFIHATLGASARDISLEPYVPDTGDFVTVEVRAAPWVPVNELWVVTAQGERLLLGPDSMVMPEDPFGDAGVVRLRRRIPLRDLIDPSRDGWFSFEARYRFFPFADLNDDGVADTTDNNGDGVVNEDDIEDGEKSGPWENPEDPTSEDDPRFWMTRVVRGAWPYAFTNAILVDWDGDSWTPPGLP